jgi:hypothetical protein
VLETQYFIMAHRFYAILVNIMVIMRLMVNNAELMKNVTRNVLKNSVCYTIFNKGETVTEECNIKV